MTRKSFSMVLFALMLLPGCAKKADNASDEAAEHTQYVQGVEQKLAGYDTEMDSVNAEFAAASAKVKADTQADLDSLRARRDRVQVSLGELRAAGGDDWEKAKDAFAEALDDLEKAIDRARDHLH